MGVTQTKYNEIHNLIRVEYTMTYKLWIFLLLFLSSGLSSMFLMDLLDRE